MLFNSSYDTKIVDFSPSGSVFAGDDSTGGLLLSDGGGALISNSPTLLVAVSTIGVALVVATVIVGRCAAF